MTASLITHVPLALGGMLASALGKAGLWALSRYARAPLAWTCGIAIGTLSAMAASNALYFQPMHHPSPLFVPRQGSVVPAVPVADVTPATRRQVIPPIIAPQTPSEPQAMPVPVAPETTASLPQQLPAGEPVGNAEVYELQKKLLALGLFEGMVDGYYGPKTARAIRAFETQAGMTPQGAMTPEVIDAIMAAPVGEPIAMRRTPPQPEPIITAALPENSAQAAQASLAPHPQSETQLQQLLNTPAATPLVPQAPVLPRAGTAGSPELVAVPVPQQEPEDLLDAAADGVAGAFDSLVAGIQDVTGNSRRLNPNVPARAPGRQEVASAPKVVPPNSVSTQVSSTDRELVSRVQRGLASLGFLAGSVDGVAGEATARAIRNFEVYYNYEVTGRVTPELIDMLAEAGASI